MGLVPSFLENQRLGMQVRQNDLRDLLFCEEERQKIRRSREHIRRELEKHLSGRSLGTYYRQKRAPLVLRIHSMPGHDHGRKWDSVCSRAKYIFF